MKLFTLILLFSLLSGSTFSQIVKGRIIDSQTREPVPFVAVYFAGTFMGTTSDQEGNFQIDVTSFVSMPLTISAIGYYSNVLSNFLIGGQVVIILTPKVYEIEEVEISGNTLAQRRKANLKAFRNEFLGKSPNARRCKILNEEDTLRAYKVTYYLDQFEFNKRTNSLYFSGSILYSEDDSTYRRFTRNRRKRAYMGSRMHFFRALWADDLYSTKFSIGASGKKLGFKDIVILSPMAKLLNYPESLVIHYAEKWSQLNFNSEFVYFARDGYFDPSGIGWVGELGKKRIGDTLPYEYTLSQ